MRAAAKMMMARNATSRNESEMRGGSRNEYQNNMEMRGGDSYNEMRGESNEMRRGGGSRNEGNEYAEMRRGGYRNEGNEGAEMRRRRDSRGRFMQAEGAEGYENEANGYQNEMRGEMRNEMRGEMRGSYRNEMEGYGGNEMRGAGNQYQAESKMEEYPKPHLLPRKQPIGFHSNPQQTKPKTVDRKTAHEWIKSMKSEDEQGAPWKSEEDVKPFMMQVKFEGNPAEFWAIMNAVYTDYSHIARKYGINKPEFYAELAKAWLEDEDAVPDKAAIYYDCIVKH